MCAVEILRPESCEINVCIDQSLRFHTAVMTLPHSKFVACVHFYNYQKRPYLVVSQDWFENIERVFCSQYALVDVVGMRRLLEVQGRVEAQQVAALREAIDAVAARNPDYAFLAFADSVIVKANWSANNSDYRRSYRPERFLTVVKETINVFKRILNLPAYAVVTQGSNQWVEDSVLKLSPSKNHVFFGSLGTPFAELFDIDQSVRAAIRARRHAPSELYLSRPFFMTLNFKNFELRDALLKQCYPFASKMTVAEFSNYHSFQYEELVTQLEEPQPWINSAQVPHHFRWLALTREALARLRRVCR
jgi:hypothetical protein